jgi:hypothetical protein
MNTERIYSGVNYELAIFRDALAPYDSFILVLEAIQYIAVKVGTK